MEAHVGDEGVERASLIAGDSLGLSAEHTSRDIPLGLVLNSAAERSQVIDILLVYWQRVCWGALVSAFRKGPATESAGAGIYNLIAFRTSETRVEGDVEGQSHDRGGRWAWGRGRVGGC